MDASDLRINIAILSATAATAAVLFSSPHTTF